MTSLNYTIPVTPDQTAATQTVNASGFFHAYENYTAAVTGRTHVGFGPVATTAGRTQPDSESVFLSLSLSFLHNSKKCIFSGINITFSNLHQIISISHNS